MSDKSVAELRRKLGAAVDELPGLVEDAKAFAAKEAEIEAIEGQIKRSESAQTRAAALARPVGANPSDVIPESEIEAPRARAFGLDGAISRGQLSNDLGSQWQSYMRAARARSGLQFQADKHFRSLGEQLQAIQQFAVTRGQAQDNRLTRAPLGAGEIDPTGGGFLLQTDFSTAIWMLAHDMGELLSRVNKIPISERSNSLKIPGVDETSRATGSRWGGVQSYWVNEGDTANATKPKFRMIDFSLHKLMSTMYMSDELIQDAPALNALAGQAFSEEIMFMTEDSIFEGSGAGMPLGIMNSPSLVSVAKQVGQQTQTIVKENIDNMWAQCWNRSRKQAVWFINQLVEPQLASLNQAVGTGGQLVYLPPGGLSSSPYATLYGRPVIATEYNNFTGTPGDIVLADLSQYTLVDKGGVQAATSMHVAFLTDQMAFRITYRVDGQPMWSKPLTPFKTGAGQSLSPFVALATR